MTPKREIYSIVGHEPRDPSSEPFYYPVGCSVGYMRYENEIVRIVRRLENYGDHSISWFDVLDADGEPLASMAERAVANICYKYGFFNADEDEQ